MKTLAELIDLGWKVTFDPHPKRMEVNGIRQWKIRMIWEAGYNSKSHSCLWDGFDTAKECIDDFILYANKTMNQP